MPVEAMTMPESFHGDIYINPRYASDNDSSANENPKNETKPEPQHSHADQPIIATVAATREHVADIAGQPTVIAPEAAASPSSTVAAEAFSSSPTLQSERIVAVHKSQKLLSGLAADKRRLMGRVRELEETLRALRDAYAAENEKLKEDNLDLEERNEALKAENLELVAVGEDVRELQAENLQLVRESVDRMAEMERLGSEVEKLAKIHAEAESSNAKVEMLKVKRRILLGALWENNASWDKKLRRENGPLPVQKKMTEHQAEIAEPQQRENSADDEDQLRIQHQALQYQNERLSAENERLTQELQSLHRQASRVPALEKELEEAKEQLRIAQDYHRKWNDRPVPGQPTPFGSYVGERPLRFGGRLPDAVTSNLQPGNGFFRRWSTTTSSDTPASAAGKTLSSNDATNSPFYTPSTSSSSCNSPSTPQYSSVEETVTASFNNTTSTSSFGSTSSSASENPTIIPTLQTPVDGMNMPRLSLAHLLAANNCLKLQQDLATAMLVSKNLSTLLQLRLEPVVVLLHHFLL
jgi:type II secretory pathway pseudopilin PulG